MADKFALQTLKVVILRISNCRIKNLTTNCEGLSFRTATDFTNKYTIWD